MSHDTIARNDAAAPAGGACEPVTPEGQAACPSCGRMDAEPSDAGSGRAEVTFARHKIFPWFFLVSLLFSLYLLYYLLQPFIHSIILACVFTAISFPFYRRCLVLTGQRRVPAALIMLLVITVIIAVLLVVIVSGLIPQAKTTIPAVNQWLAGAHLVDTLETHIRPIILWLQQHFPEMDITLEDIRANILNMSRSTGQYLLGSATSFLGNTVLFFAHLLLVLLMMFFLFIDGESHLRRLSYLFPMKQEQTAIVVESLRRMSKAVLVGGLSVAVLQGIAGGIGFAIVGIPPLFWGTVMVFAAFVPVVGTGLVWVPAVAYLGIMGEWSSAVFLGLWCGIGVTSIDSILRPILMRGGAKIPVLFIFLSILGGINVFGMLGLLYGPLILGLVAVMIAIYAEEYKDVLQFRSGQREEYPSEQDEHTPDA